jgi:hypothetical protein
MTTGFGAKHETLAYARGSDRKRAITRLARLVAGRN